MTTSNVVFLSRFHRGRGFLRAQRAAPRSLPAHRAARRPDERSRRAASRTCSAIGIAQIEDLPRSDRRPDARRDLLGVHRAHRRHDRDPDPGRVQRLLIRRAPAAPALSLLRAFAGWVRAFSCSAPIGFALYRRLVLHPTRLEGDKLEHTDALIILSADRRADGDAAARPTPARISSARRSSDLKSSSSRFTRAGASAGRRRTRRIWSGIVLVGARC